jgi:hypothetical protein
MPLFSGFRLQAEDLPAETGSYDFAAEARIFRLKPEATGIWPEPEDTESGSNQKPRNLARAGSHVETRWELDTGLN